MTEHDWSCSTKRLHGVVDVDLEGDWLKVEISAPVLGLSSMARLLRLMYGCVETKAVGLAVSAISRVDGVPVGLQAICNSTTLTRRPDLRDIVDVDSAVHAKHLPDNLVIFVQSRGLLRLKDPVVYEIKHGLAGRIDFQVQTGDYLGLELSHQAEVSARPFGWNKG